VAIFHSGVNRHLPEELCRPQKATAHAFMKPAFKPHHIQRYRDIARLLWKYGRADIVRQTGLDAALNGQVDPGGVASGVRPEELADDLERMGPTFIKLGQLLSGRSDLLPDPYIQALARLQDKVKPFSYEEVESIVQSELGVRISKAFSEFESEPLAAASLGQVHRAKLKDGRAVAVKVQRPLICDQIREDLEVLEQTAVFLDNHTEIGGRYQFTKVFEELQRTLLRELDYQREAANLIALAENLKDFERLLVPAPVEGYTTTRVLTMEYISGAKITSISPLARLETNGRDLAEELFRAYLKQVLVDGLFHADPHPGNVFLTEDGRIALLDLGMVGRIPPQMQERLMRLLLAISETRSDEASDLVISISRKRDDFNEVDFCRNISRIILENQHSTIDQLDIGVVLMEVSRCAANCGLLVAPELTLLGKTLLSLDQVGRILDPDFNPNSAIRHNVSEIMNRRILKGLTPGNLLLDIFELKDFAGNLPGRLNKILDAIASAQLEVKIKATDTETLLEGFQKIANRVAAGLILAALIVGASIMMNVETTFQLFGYPGLAILFFCFATGGAFWLLFSIFTHDIRSRSRRRPFS
jgi:ubiquinone biosynthesis protein